MAELYGVDISQWQGQVDWDALNAASNFVVIRLGDGTLLDTQFARNQSEARRVRASAGPLGIGYYYFAEPSLLGAEASARYFVTTLGQLEEGELLALDLEGNIGSAPVAWSLDWLATVELLTGVKALVYINQSILTGYDWKPVVDRGYGLWVADYDGDKTSVPPQGQWPVVAMKQWTDVDVVNGSPTKVDGDTFYGDFNAWYAYGYHVPTSTPPATPTPPPVVVTPPVATPPVETPAPPATPPPETAPSSSPDVKPPLSAVPAGSSLSSFFNSVLGRAFLSAFATVLTPVIMSLQNFHTQNATLATAIVAAVGILLTVRDLANNRIPNLPK